MSKPGSDNSAQRKKENLWDACYDILCRFFFSALMGGLVVLAVTVILFIFGVYFQFTRPFAHAYWIIPLLWGIFGIIRFDQMLVITRDFIERVLGRED